MEKYKDKINWPEEFRRFVLEKIRELEKISINIPRGFAKASVREDRDRY